MYICYFDESGDDGFPNRSSDMVAYIVYLYICNNIHQPRKSWSSRLLQVLNYGDEVKLLDKIRNTLDLKASKSTKFGIKIHPL